VILLIGGNGFLGRHLTDLLSERGYEVTAVTRAVDGINSYSGVRQLVLAATLESDDGFREVVEKAKIVVYLASVSVPSTFADEPWREATDNVTPALKFFARCGQMNPAAKVILVSSGGTIYGGSSSEGVSEEAPLQPCSAYGLGKLMIENGLSYMGRVYGLSYRILRVSNPVGKWQSSNVQGVVPAILRSVKMNVPFSVFGDGEQIRDYVDADDVASAILACIEDSEHFNRIWNVGSGFGRSVLDIIATVESVVKRAVEVKFYPPRSSDIRSIVLDCSRIHRELGWRSKTGLKTSIEKVVGAGLLF
jgi:UDP-glucose 4-epimerase